MNQKLTYQAASDYADQLHKASTDVKTIVDTIKNEFDHVGSIDYWAGDIANNTKNEFTTLANQLENFITVLTEEANYLDTVIEEYHSADEEVRSKSNSEIADEVIQGKWGNGPERKEALANAGYDAKEVQNIVNQKLAGTYVEESGANTGSATSETAKALNPYEETSGPIKTGIPGEDTFVTPDIGSAPTMSGTGGAGAAAVSTTTPTNATAPTTMATTPPTNPVDTTAAIPPTTPPTSATVAPAASITPTAGAISLSDEATAQALGVSLQQLDVIKATVRHEAGNSPAEIMNVTSAVKNRMNANGYPDNAYSVITAPKQFQSYGAGYYQQYTGGNYYQGDAATQAAVNQAMNAILLGEMPVTHPYGNFRGKDADYPGSVQLVPNGNQYK